MHICSTWSEDVCVVLGLSSYRSDLKVTSFTDKAMMLGGGGGGCLPAISFYYTQ